MSKPRGKGKNALLPHGVQLAAFDDTINVILWAIERRLPLTVEAIMERWNVHKATAYRWLQPLANAQERMRPVIFPRSCGCDADTATSRTSTEVRAQ